MTRVIFVIELIFLVLQSMTFSRPGYAGIRTDAAAEMDLARNMLLASMVIAIAEIGLIWMDMCFPKAIFARLSFS
jgi:hypothetical protein